MPLYGERGEQLRCYPRHSLGLLFSSSLGRSLGKHFGLDSFRPGEGSELFLGQLRGLAHSVLSIERELVTLRLARGGRQLDRFAIDDFLEGLNS